jgi:anti-anti-sigma regulatory factor
MNLTVDRADGAVPITILRIEGDLDASNYEQLIAEGARLHEAGTAHLILDMTAVPYMGSSGLVALHSIALLLEGRVAPDPEAGWGAHHEISKSVEAGMQPYLKLVIPEVAGSLRRVMERTGMDRFIEIHPDEAAAIAAF